MTATTRRRTRKAHTTREGWLVAAVEMLRPMFTEHAEVTIPPVRVSCGFPGGGSARTRIAECWKMGACGSGVPEIFVSPVLENPIGVLAALTHELVHAWDNGEHGHKGAFRTVAVAVGLEGKMTATVAGSALVARLVAMSTALGPYPHAAVNIGLNGRKIQGTRMLKVECPVCGYMVRTTAKWLAVGTPTCPCGEEMVIV